MDGGVTRKITVLPERDENDRLERRSRVVRRVRESASDAARDPTSGPGSRVFVARSNWPDDREKNWRGPKPLSFEAIRRNVAGWRGVDRDLYLFT